VSEAFEVVIERWRTICGEFMRITFVANGNSLAAPVVGWFLCAPKYLAGTMSLGAAAQTVAAFVTVQASLNWLVDNYGALAECLSSVNRVASLLLALDEIERGDD
jgi:putative ATP-binding cassette transporter